MCIEKTIQATLWLVVHNALAAMLFTGIVGLIFTRSL